MSAQSLEKIDIDARPWRERAALRHDQSEYERGLRHIVSFIEAKGGLISPWRRSKSALHGLL